MLLAAVWLASDPVAVPVELLPITRLIRIERRDARSPSFVAVEIVSAGRRSLVSPYVAISARGLLERTGHLICVGDGVDGCERHGGDDERVWASCASLMLPPVV